MNLITSVQVDVVGWETNHGEMDGNPFDNLTLYYQENITPRQGEAGNGHKVSELKIRGEGQRYSAQLMDQKLPCRIEVQGELNTKKDQYGRQVQQFEGSALKVITKAA